MPNLAYEPRYDSHHALVIGISDYAYISPLEWGVKDASKVADVLVTHCGFPEPKRLLGPDATRERILSELHAVVRRTRPDDRLVVFFAGHGAYDGPDGRERGFLVPYDHRPGDIASLIRWEELRFAAENCPAKHIIFVIDACYSGLAVRRRLAAGTIMDLRRSLRMRAVQVLTAGTGIQTVADLGVDFPGHSPFTGHLVEGLTGAVADANAVITASRVMSYVREKVRNDQEARQTPFFGWIEGEGDLIFSVDGRAPVLDDQGEESRSGAAPGPHAVFVPTLGSAGDPAAEVKKLILDPRALPRLRDLVAREVDRVLQSTSDSRFSLEAPWTEDDFRRRVADYDAALRDLGAIQAVIGYYGGSPDILTLAVKRLCERIALSPGPEEGWLALRWYPVMCVLYSGGVAATAAARYDNVHALLSATGAGQRLINRLTEGIKWLDNSALINIGGRVVFRNDFKLMPGHESDRAARSEYLYEILKPCLDELHLADTEYDDAFDRFEIFYWLQHAHWNGEPLLRGGPPGVPPPPLGWLAPVGRFAFPGGPGTPLAAYGGFDAEGKFLEPVADNARINQVAWEARQQGGSWAPLAAGLFGGSFERFQKLIALLGPAVTVSGAPTPPEVSSRIPGSVPAARPSDSEIESRVEPENQQLGATSDSQIPATTSAASDTSRTIVRSSPRLSAASVLTALFSVGVFVSLAVNLYALADFGAENLGIFPQLARNFYLPYALASAFNLGIALACRHGRPRYSQQGHQRYRYFVIAGISFMLAGDLFNSYFLPDVTGENTEWIYAGLLWPTLGYAFYAGAFAERRFVRPSLLILPYLVIGGVLGWYVWWYDTTSWQAIWPITKPAQILYVIGLTVMAWTAAERLRRHRIPRAWIAAAAGALPLASAAMYWAVVSISAGQGVYERLYPHATVGTAILAAFSVVSDWLVAISIPRAGATGRPDITTTAADVSTADVRSARGRVVRIPKRLAFLVIAAAIVLLGGYGVAVNRVMVRDYDLARFGVANWTEVGGRMVLYGPSQEYSDKAGEVWYHANAPSTILTQYNCEGKTASVTLYFREPLYRIAFHRAGLRVERGRVIHPAWTARALVAAGGSAIAAVDEPLIVLSDGAYEPPRRFDLVDDYHRGITAVQFESNYVLPSRYRRYGRYATFCAVLVSDLTLVRSRWIDRIVQGLFPGRFGP